MNRFVNYMMALLAIMMPLALVSCGDDPDGLWTPMKWNDSSGLPIEKDAYIVPAEGGTYEFACLNYSAPWISHAKDEDGAFLADEWKAISNSWFHARFNKANLSITISPLPEEQTSRNVSLTVTAGDIFDTFSFVQRR